MSAGQDSQESRKMADTPQQIEESKPAGTENVKGPAPEKIEEKKPGRPLGRRLGEHPIKVFIFLVILAGVAVAGYRFWNYLESYESTDDAQIDGDIYPVTSRIAGTIRAVYVQDNQPVKAGQLLVELDPRPYQIALEQAQAALNESRSLVAVARPGVPITSETTRTGVATAVNEVAESRASVAVAQRDYESATADTRRAEAESARAQADLNRYKQLIAKEEISKLQYDQAEAAAKSAAADVEERSNKSCNSEKSGTSEFRGNHWVTVPA